MKASLSKPFLYNSTEDIIHFRNQSILLPVSSSSRSTRRYFNSIVLMATTTISTEIRNRFMFIYNFRMLWECFRLFFCSFNWLLFRNVDDDNQISAFYILYPFINSFVNSILLPLPIYMTNSALRTFTQTSIKEIFKNWNTIGKSNWLPNSMNSWRVSINFFTKCFWIEQQ